MPALSNCFLCVWEGGGGGGGSRRGKRKEWMAQTDVSNERGWHWRRCYTCALMLIWNRPRFWLILILRYDLIFQHHLSKSSPTYILYIQIPIHIQTYTYINPPSISLLILFFGLIHDFMLLSLFCPHFLLALVNQTCLVHRFFCCWKGLN